MRDHSDQKPSYHELVASLAKQREENKRLKNEMHNAAVVWEPSYQRRLDDLQSRLSAVEAERDTERQRHKDILRAVRADCQLRLSAAEAKCNAEHNHSNILQSRLSEAVRLGTKNGLENEKLRKRLSDKTEDVDKLCRQVLDLQVRLSAAEEKLKEEAGHKREAVQEIERLKDQFRSVTFAYADQTLREENERLKKTVIEMTHEDVAVAKMLDLQSRLSAAEEVVEAAKKARMCYQSQPGSDDYVKSFGWWDEMQEALRQYEEGKC